MKYNYEEHIGHEIGRLTLLKVITQSRRCDSAKRQYYVCRCACGQQKIILASSILRNGTKSCGCLQRDTARTENLIHGGSHDPEYDIWRKMIARCYNTNKKEYHRYGGRGIKVCDRWRYSYANFINDVGHRPSSKYSIDRIDNDGDYVPSNVKWSTHREQCNNKEGNVILSFNGITTTVAEWSRLTGISKRVIGYRLGVGWPVERILTMPVQKRTKQ